MKKGDYVFFDYDKKTFKGRISSQNDELFLCQSVFAHTTCDEQFGEESARYIGRKNHSSSEHYITYYNIRVVSKKDWDLYNPPVIKKVFGYSYSKIGNSRKNPTYSFGCGEITLTKEQIIEFTNSKDEYLAVTEKIAKLTALLRKENAALDNWHAKYPNSNAVLDALKRRGIKPTSVNIEKVKRLFK